MASAGEDKDVLSTVVATCISGDARSFTKVPTPEIQLVSDFGVVGDRHAGRDPNRNVLLTTEAAYDFLKAAGLELPYGSLAENLVLQTDRESIAPGATLALGDGAVIEITHHAPRCRRLREVHPDLLRLLSEHRGVYARVVRSGTVCVGDAVAVFSQI